MTKPTLKQLTNRVAGFARTALGLRGTVLASNPTVVSISDLKAPIRPFATEAHLLSVKDNLKTYSVTWLDRQARGHVTTATGENLKNALDTVLRSRQAYWFNSVSEWILSLSYGSFIVMSIVSIMGNNPLRDMGILFAVSVALVLYIRRYFRNVNLLA